jgi:hypothetical protein
MVTGNEGEPIPYETAVSWINTFKNQNPNAVYAQLYGINKVNTLLAQPGTKGLRIYHSINPQGEKKLILFAVDKNGDAIEGYVLEHGLPCPPTCGRP